jgi:hypothetical protein
MPARPFPMSVVIRPSLRWLDTCGLWLLDRRGMGTFLGVPVENVSRLHRSGRIPLPIRFNYGPLRYAVPELRDWVRMGCPRMDEWIALRGLSGNTLIGNWGRLPNRLDGEPVRPVGPAVEPRV